MTIIDVFTYGATITVRDAQYLAIPEGPAKAIVRRLNQAANRLRDANGQFADENGYVQRVAQALGVERLEAQVDQRSGRGVLVAAGQRLTKGGRQSRSQKPGPATVLFALVKQATIRGGRMRGQALIDDLRTRGPSDFASALASNLAPEDRG